MTEETLDKRTIEQTPPEYKSVLEGYFRGVRPAWSTYPPDGHHWNRDDCDLCGRPILTEGGGFTANNDKHWLCFEGFQELRHLFDCPDANLRDPPDLSIVSHSCVDTRSAAIQRIDEWLDQGPGMPEDHHARLKKGLSALEDSGARDSMRAWCEAARDLLGVMESSLKGEAWVPGSIWERIRIKLSDAAQEMARYATLLYDGPGESLDKAVIAALREGGESLYVRFTDSTPSLNEARAILESFAIAGGGALLVGVNARCYISGVDPFDLDAIIDLLRKAGSLLDPRFLRCHAENYWHDWLAYAVVGDPTTGFAVEEESAFGFSNLTPPQRRLLATIIREVDTGLCRSEIEAVEDADRGWCLKLTGRNRHRDRTLGTFTEVHLRTLRDEGYISLLSAPNGNYKLRLRSRARQDYRKAVQEARSRPLRVFVSYARVDAAFRADLGELLDRFERDGLTTRWEDVQLRAGQEWAKEIEQQMEQADLFLMLMSPDFLISDFINEQEVRRALERHREGTVDIVPILVRRCEWPDSPLAALQAVPRDLEPIEEYPEQQWEEVSKELERLIDERRQRRRS